MYRIRCQQTTFSLRVTDSCGVNGDLADRWYRPQRADVSGWGLDARVKRTTRAGESDLHAPRIPLKESKGMSSKWRGEGKRKQPELERKEGEV